MRWQVFCRFFTPPLNSQSKKIQMFHFYWIPQCRHYLGGECWCFYDAVFSSGSAAVSIIISNNIFRLLYKSKIIHFQKIPLNQDIWYPCKRGLWRGVLFQSLYLVGICAQSLISQGSICWFYHCLFFRLKISLLPIMLSIPRDRPYQTKQGT